MRSKSQTGINLLFYHREINALFTMIKFSWRTSTTFLAKRNERYFLLRLFTYTLKMVDFTPTTSRKSRAFRRPWGWPKNWPFKRFIFSSNPQRLVCYIAFLSLSSTFDCHQFFHWYWTLPLLIRYIYHKIRRAILFCVRSFKKRTRDQLLLQCHFVIWSPKAVDFKKIVELISKSKHVFVCVSIKKPERSCGRSRGRN